MPGLTALGLPWLSLAPTLLLEQGSASWYAARPALRVQVLAPLHADIGLGVALQAAIPRVQDEESWHMSQGWYRAALLASWRPGSERRRLLAQAGPDLTLRDTRWTVPGRELLFDVQPGLLVALGLEARLSRHLWLTGLWGSGWRGRSLDLDLSLGLSWAG